MFENIQRVETSAVADSDRVEFAKAYLTSVLADRTSISSNWSFDSIDMDIDVGSGDTRPLVRHLRMIAFYVVNFLEKRSDNADNNSNVRLRLTTSDGNNKSVDMEINGSRIQLVHDPECNNLYSSATPIHNEVAKSLSASVLTNANQKRKFARVCDYYFDKTLTPAVVVSKNKETLRALADELSAADGVHAILGVNPENYKMMRSLYDSRETPNLRDDILNFGGETAEREACLC